MDPNAVIMPQAMMQEAFAPIAAADAQVLILGSMPSAVSLAEHQYYAHSRNHFWTIMGALFGARAELAYAERCRILTDNRIALWDVIAACARRGSLDSNIITKSICVNSFKHFFRHHAAIHTVFFNGSKAQQIYRSLVLPTLPTDIELNYIKLPSTSPANATFTLAAKRDAWQIVKQKNHAQG